MLQNNVQTYIALCIILEYCFNGTTRHTALEITFWASNRMNFK
jgi:hypothetical protein